VKISSFIHTGLKKLYADDSAKGVPPDTVDKLRKMFAFLDAMKDLEELRALAAWKAHTLTGERKGDWSLSVTRNRLLTFRINTAEPTHAHERTRRIPATLSAPRLLSLLAYRSRLRRKLCMCPVLPCPLC
jgi:proteic killer suppression protein